jgi:hypothetical protein
MEADWEVEIGPDAHVIDAVWPGFVDLRRAPELIGEIGEATRFPALAEALLRLNEPGLRLWTSKCDLWALDPNLEPWDPDEMAATRAESLAGLACYIDLMPADGSLFAGLEEAEAWMRTTVKRLHEMDCRCCRVDLVIRRAFQENREGMGVTAYTIGCGSDPEAAAIALGDALAALVEAVGAAMNGPSKISGALQ